MSGPLYSLSKLQRRLLVGLAALGFVVVFVLTLVLARPQGPGPLAYAPSVALFTVVCGALPGVAAALLASALYSIGYWIQFDEPSVGRIASRAFPLLIVGWLVGWLGERLRASDEELAAARAGRSQATELNDNIVQGLALAKYALQRGGTDQAAEVIDGTLRQARSMTSDLIGDAPVAPGELRRRRAVETK